jgi:hypothetical protein
LSSTYETIYGSGLSKSTISEFFRKSGYRFKKAKKTLTSSDPKFREKLDLIKKTLAELGNDEKFFSIDEFGPFSVKIRGGRALVPSDVVRTFPQSQRSKGSIICTAALELSTNQMTHFYSTKKNSGEMIKLIAILLTKYPKEKRLIISWDSASWHASKALYKKVDELNSEESHYSNASPLVVLMPLPIGSQLLNVIESYSAGCRGRFSTTATIKLLMIARMPWIHIFQIETTHSQSIQYELEEKFGDKRELKRCSGKRITVRTRDGDNEQWPTLVLQAAEF